MSICFLSSHHIYLGTWVCRYFLPILTKYHFIREAKCNGFSNEYPNQAFVTTWRQPTLRKLEYWNQVICGYIGIIVETRIWELSGNHIFSPSSLLWQSTYYLLWSFNIIVFLLVKFLQILYNGQCAIIMTINTLPALFVWYYCFSTCKILANSVQWSVCTDIGMAAIIYYLFVLSHLPRLNVTIYVRSFQLTSL